jgi:hypothetical protein
VWGSGGNEDEDGHQLLMESEDEEAVTLWHTSSSEQGNTKP